MNNNKAELQTSCDIRCMDPVHVEEAMLRLDPEGFERIA